MTPLLAAVGPLTFPEHVAWFLFLSLFVFLVYNGLRADTVGLAVRRALRRWVVFLAGSTVLALVFLTLAHFL